MNLPQKPPRSRTPRTALLCGGLARGRFPLGLLFTIGAGGRVADLGAGNTTLDESEARRGFQFWLDLARQYGRLRVGRK